MTKFKFEALLGTLHTHFQIPWKITEYRLTSEIE